MSGKRILTLVGSPRAKGTSEALARYMTDGLIEQGWQGDVERISLAIHKPEQWAKIEQAFLSADLILLSCPLYVDSLPAETTLALERLAELRRAHPPTQSQRMMAVIQCGFYEHHQNDVALAICQQFAKETGITWSGGLGIGGGGAIGGQQLKKANGMTRNLTAALDLAVEALATGKDVPDEAVETIHKPVFPAGFYFLVANLSMMKEAMDNHVLLKINAKPYQRPLVKNTV